MKGKTILGEGQMIMEVNSKGTLKIRLNTDKDCVYYQAEDLSNNDLTTEIPALKGFIDDNTDLPSTTKFVTKNEGGNDYTADDIEERRKNPLPNTK